jgi:toxin ParE1/3/4
VIAITRLVGDHPLIGTVRPELANEPFRFTVVRGFPYVVVYDASQRPPLIMRIVHGARDLTQVLRGLR